MGYSFSQDDIPELIRKGRWKQIERFRDELEFSIDEINDALKLLHPVKHKTAIFFLKQNQNVLRKSFASLQQALKNKPPDNRS